VAIAVRDGKAIAYVCDGRTKEAWLRGDVADDGTMRLTSSPKGSTLTGTLAGSHITGSVQLPGRTWKFTAAKAVKPSGLYRATARVSGAKVEGGWIVLPDGKQVGIVDRDGEPSAAPSIDPQTGAVTVDGEQLTAKPVVP
jgi:serine/threonine-protein kinase